MSVTDDVQVDNSAPLVARNSVNERVFGIVTIKRYPPYVFGIRGLSCLVHRVRSVEAHWYRYVNGSQLQRLLQPVLIAHTACAQSFRLQGEISRTCHVPRPDALLCGRCQAKPATFPRSVGGRAKESGLTRQEAHVKLGCVVKGY